MSDASAEAGGSAATAIALTATDVNGDSLELRVVSQPIGGLAWIDGATAYYRPLPGFAGTDAFTFAAWDGKADSNLGTVTLTVAGEALFRDGFETGDTTEWSSTAPCLLQVVSGVSSCAPDRAIRSTSLAADAEATPTGSMDGSSTRTGSES